MLFYSERNQERTVGDLVKVLIVLLLAFAIFFGTLEYMKRAHQPKAVEAEGKDVVRIDDAL